MDNFVRKVKSYICRERLLDPGDKVLIGVSGGADSMALLLALHALEEELSISCGAMHVVHGIRGKEAREDAEFVEECCGKMQVPFYLRSFDVPAFAKENKMTEEEAGRVLRYKAFESCAREEGYTKTAVAHHQEDNTETMLFQLLRGSGPAGAGGIPPKRGSIIRPLLWATREEIESFLSENGVSWRTDSTNLQADYSRNRIRQQVLPLLESIQPGASAHLARSAGYFREADRYLARQAQKEEAGIFHKEGRSLLLDCQALDALPEVLRRYVLMDAMEKACGHRKDLTQRHISALDGLAGKPAGSRADLPYGMTAVKEYGSIRLFQGSLQDLREAALRKEILEKAACFNGKEKFSAAEGVGMPPDAEGPGQDLLPESEGREMLAEMAGQGQKLAYIYTESMLPFRLHASLLPREQLTDSAINKEEMYTKYLDYDKITGSLSLRTRREGDYFILDAQGHRKKLKRWFSDSRIPAWKRDEVPIVADERHVVWIVGGRIGFDCRVTERTSRVLKLEVLEEEQKK